MPAFIVQTAWITSCTSIVAQPLPLLGQATARRRAPPLQVYISNAAGIRSLLARGLEPRAQTCACPPASQPHEKFCPQASFCKLPCINFTFMMELTSRTPRAMAHMCLPSISTAAPSGWTSCCRNSAIRCAVRS